MKNAKLLELSVGDRVVLQSQPASWASEYSDNMPIPGGALSSDDFPISAEVLQYEAQKDGRNDYFPAELKLEGHERTYGFDMSSVYWEWEKKAESSDEMHPADYTREHLEQWIGEEIKANDIKMEDILFALFATFGEEIHEQIDGFIQYAESYPDIISEEQIKHTLLHDVGGALRNDKLMLPRVSDYGEYSII